MESKVSLVNMRKANNELPKITSTIQVSFIEKDMLKKIMK